ncbi:MAG: hypothetical protein CM15mP44_5610 [Candidatus Neomarinimicrobiota bacterium]|nr:MAG: hypothetical protein CM15mP44_5610 [Candidatus Neomarinimicrobiota bacterium]
MNGYEVLEFFEKDKAYYEKPNNYAFINDDFD